MSSIQGPSNPVTTPQPTVTETPTQTAETTTQVITETRVSTTGSETTAVVEEGYEISTGSAAVAADGTYLSTGEAVSPELLAQLGVLVEKGSVPGATAAQTGDVDIEVAENLTGIPLGSTQSAMTALATAYPSLGETGQNQAADFIAGFGASGRAAQAYVAQEQFGMSSDALHLQLNPTLQGIGALTASSGALDASSVLGQPATAQINENFSTFLDKLPTDPNALVQWVLRESYLESTQDLEMYANKVKFYNDCKQKIRAELKRARNIAAGMAGKADTTALSQVFQPATINTEYYGQQTSDTTAASASATAAPAAPTYPSNTEVVGWYTSGHKSMADLVSMYQNGQISAANLTAVRDQLNSKYQASGTQESVSKSFNTNYSVGNKLTSDALATDLSNRATQYVQNFMSWFNGLSQQQQQAVIKQLQTKGLTVSAWGQEGGLISHKEKSTQTATAKLSGTDVESYVTKLVNQAVGDVKNDMDSWYGGWEGSKLEDVKLDMKTTLPTATYTQLGTAPADLTTANSALGVAGSSSSGSSTSTDGAIDTKAKLDTYIKNMEDKLNSVGDDAQLANVDLQNMLQKQQQTLQMMSNISKMLNDTAMAVIRKIGG